MRRIALIKNKGFTLIELLVVVALIAILAGIILVALNNAKFAAEDAKSIASVHDLNNAITSYYFDKNAYPPATVIANSGIDLAGDVLVQELVADHYLSTAQSLENPSWYLYVHICDLNTFCSPSNASINALLMSQVCLSGNSTAAFLFRLNTPSNSYGVWSGYNFICY